MSLPWFTLPAPVELGDGWSMTPLTAARMLECRGEGEAMAGEERDKALWANAQLLSQVLLKEGEPPFEDGAAVLEHLTAGQIRDLARRWWEQDDFSRPIRWEQDDLSRPQRREEWTATEGSENEHFDMARFLALGGEDPARTTGRENTDPVRQAWSSWRWPGEDLSVRDRVSEVPAVLPPLRADEDGSGVWETPQVRTDRRDEEAYRPEDHRLVRLPEPETAPAGEGLTLEELDRAVERDSRRYDGSSPLY